MSFLLELREALKAEPNPDKRAGLKAIADELATHLTDLHKNPSRENMVAVNGAWVRAEVALLNVTPKVNPDPPMGAGEVQEAKAA